MTAVVTAWRRWVSAGAQFWLLAAVNVLVGSMVGQERTTLPLLASDVFGVEALTVALTTIVAFGAAKAVTNLVAGRLADTYGRKPVLVTGWLIAAGVPVMTFAAPAWSWIVAANVLLGVSQGLTWSSTVVMKADLVDDRRRGFAMGINEAAGYGGVAAAAALTGLLVPSVGLRQAALVVAGGAAVAGIVLSWRVVAETQPQADRRVRDAPDELDRQAAHTLAAAGLANNLNDGMVWGLLPPLFAAAGADAALIGLLVAIYPATWAVGQLVTGPASDRRGRRPFATAGLAVQALALALFAVSDDVAGWALSGVLLGVGTAAAYPTLLAAVTDIAPSAQRGSALGRYRFWRDSGFVVGALLAGIVADIWGIRPALWSGAAATLLVAVYTALRLRETAPLVTSATAA